MKTKPGHRKSGQAAAEPASLEANFVRAQRERAAAIAAERHRLVDALEMRLETLLEETHRIYPSAVAMRLLAMRNRQRGAVARLLQAKPVIPVETEDV